MKVGRSENKEWEEVGRRQGTVGGEGWGRKCRERSPAWIRSDAKVVCYGGGTMRVGIRLESLE